MQPTQSEVAAHLKGSFARMMRFATERFDLGGSGGISNALLTFSFRDCKRLGLGGIKNIRGVRRPFIKLNLHNVVSYPVVGFSEYRSFNGSTRIGGFPTQDWRQWVDALLAHELAHVVQFVLPGSTSALRVSAVQFDGLPRYEGNHGDFFKAIYGILRAQFINGEVKSIGTHAPGKDFDIPAGTLPTRLQRTRITENFPFQGRMVHLGSLRLEVIEFNKSARKYQYVAQTPTGKRYKISQMQLVAGLQALAA